MSVRSSARPASLLFVLLTIVAALAAATSASAAGISPALKSADRARDRSDRALVSGAHRHRPCAQATTAQGKTRCAKRRLALQRAGKRLAEADREFAHKSVVTERKAELARRQLPPALEREDGKLKWTKVADVRTYLVIRKARGMTSHYSVVRARSIDPPAVPGKTITYRVRSAVYGSAWSAPQQVTYAPKPRQDPKSAPIPSISGSTLSWTKVGDVEDYVIVRKVAGQEDRYTAVHGTSATIAPVPGATATYAVRTAVSGSAWSAETSVTFAAEASAPAPAPAPTTTATSNSATPGFQVGLGVRIWQSEDAKAMSILKPKLVRFEFDAANPSEGTPWIDFYSARGAQTQPLAGFDSIPTDAEVDALAAWARSQAGRIKLLEFGNETYINISDQGAAYARAAKRLAQALAGSGVGVLIQADDNNSGRSWWIDAMYQAVPDLHKYAAGWVIHPYGPPSVNLARLNKVWGMVNKYGGGGVKFYATEFGMAVDDGRTLSDNYAYPVNLTYAQAGPLLTQAIEGFRTSGKIAQVIIYQSTDQRAPGSSNDREGYFGVLQAGGGLKGAYTQAAIAALAS